MRTAYVGDGLYMDVQERGYKAYKRWKKPDWESKVPDNVTKEEIDHSVEEGRKNRKATGYWGRRMERSLTVKRGYHVVKKP